MNKNRYKNSSIILLLFLVFGVSIFTGCEESATSTFEAKRSLFFENEDGQDTLNVSFSHYPGKENIIAEFKVKLIGDLLTKDSDYRVKVVDTLSTATADEYEIVNTVFRADSTSDKFIVKLKKSERMSTQAVRVVFEIEENDIFGQGYFNKLTVQLTFDNIESTPLWWDSGVVTSYLGTYSKKKFEVFYEATGFNTLEDIESWDRRKLCIKTKEFIAKNGITEEDGSPMIIPCF